MIRVIVLLILLTPALSWAQNGGTAINPFVGTCDQFQPGIGGAYCLNFGTATMWAPFFGDVVSVMGTPFCSPTDTSQCGKMTVQGINGVPLIGHLTITGQYWCYQSSDNTMRPCGP